LDVQITDTGKIFINKPNELATNLHDHNFDIEELVQIGRDAECAAFARAVKWHCEHRIIVNGNKTVVFK
jgi:formyltetrahydrofolate deformylase